MNEKKCDPSLFLTSVVTIVRFDNFVNDIKSGNILTDNEFELFEYDEDEMTTTCCGCWIQTDNKGTSC